MLLFLLFQHIECAFFQSISILVVLIFNRTKETGRIFSIKNKCFLFFLIFRLKNFNLWIYLNLLTLSSKFKVLFQNPLYFNNNIPHSAKHEFNIK